MRIRRICYTEFIMTHTLTPSAQKIQNALKKLGFSFQVRELPESTRTSSDAASAIDCKVEQIAKSIVFRGKDSYQPILVIAGGANRINEEKLSKLVGEPVEKADADFVYEATGFAIGGIPPLGHKRKIQTLIDKDLLSYQEIWAAAGSSHAVFKLTPDDLTKMTKGQVVSVV